MSKTIDQKIEFYAEKINGLQQALRHYKKQTSLFASIRFLYFLATIIISVYFINERNGLATTLILLPFPIVFGWLVNRHKSKKRHLSITENKLEYLNQEIQRLELKLSDLPGGEQFQEDDHPYAADMDLFGQHSIFSLINRSVLDFGMQRLANWLKKPASPAIIRKRQEAVEELKNDFDWRLNWWAYSRITKPKKEVNAQNTLDNFINSSTAKPKLNYIILPLIGLLQLVIITSLCFIHILPWSFLGLGLLINILLLIPANKQVMELKTITENLNIYLQQHKNLFQLAENKTVKSELLISLQNQIRNPSASQKIFRLSKLLNWMQSRDGMMYWLVNAFFLIDYFILYGTLKWKRENGSSIINWFDSIAQWEAILSLSDFAFAHEKYKTANILESGCTLDGKNIGHPLINHQDRVSNDFAMTGPGAIALITGANMSGKSTFERALGINIILAQSGAVCCVEKLTLSSISLFTSMRTQDKLEDNTSSFFAELKRLKRLVDITENEPQQAVFYLLDEILKGTNSEDRNIGAESLIRQLVKTNSMGLISTHDLSLAKLEQQLDHFSNYSFNSDVSGDEILFDYKLHKGPCHTFNAVPLMKKMGIQIIEGAKKH